MPLGRILHDCVFRRIVWMKELEPQQTLIRLTVPFDWGNLPQVSVGCRGIKPANQIAQKK